MKKVLSVLIMLVLLCLVGCNSQDTQPYKADIGTLTDFEGNSFELKKDLRVVSAYASFSECWLLSGGTLVGVTSDAIDERGMVFDNDVEIIGTVKDINLEKVVSLNPDYVILSEDITAHHELKESLSKMGIAYGYYRIDTFDDYDGVMRMFCSFNERDDLYNENVTKVKEKIEQVKNDAPENSDKTFLLMRAYSTGIKVKTDNIADEILKELGTVSIIDKSPSLLNNFSVEGIIKENPDYIFILTMGDEEKAYEYLKNNVEINPAWKELDAVKNGRYIMLPKDLFHYKPNNRWGESYEYLAKILYPEIFG